MFDFLSGLPPFALVLIATGFTWGVTALGAAMVFFFKKVNRAVLDIMMGFSAGVMIAASFWSLLSPAIDLSAELGYLPWLFPAIGFFAGGLFVVGASKLLDYALSTREDKRANSAAMNLVDGIMSDPSTSNTPTDAPITQDKNALNPTSFKDKNALNSTSFKDKNALNSTSVKDKNALAVASFKNKNLKSKPHKKNKDKKNATHTTSGLKRSILLVCSITLHNIPEGLSVGVAFGAMALGIAGCDLVGAVLLAIGIGIQNFPEGASVSLPLRREGFSLGKSFFFGQASGFVEPIAAILGFFLATTMRAILPFALAFSAGAMISVVTSELIPESTLKTKNLAVIGCLIGFLVMMILDVSLG